VSEVFKTETFDGSLSFLIPDAIALFEELIQRCGYLVIGRSRPYAIGEVIDGFDFKQGDEIVGSFRHPFRVIAKTTFEEWREQITLACKLQIMPVVPTPIGVDQSHFFYRIVTD
jgi:hypothetical protein